MRSCRLGILAALLLFCFLQCARSGARAEDKLPAVPDTYNYVLGTQAIGAAYHFTSESPLVEQARAIAVMGSNTVKFTLAIDKGETVEPKPVSLVDVVRRVPSVKAVLGMPFARYLLWAYPISADANRFAKDSLPDEYREMYDLTRYLLQTYRRTGKSFYVGNWEGDWHLLHLKPDYQPTPAEVENLVAWTAIRQKAVADARRATGQDGVHVYYYLEVNRVVDAMQGKTRLTNSVLPKVNVDYVSYSAYDSLGGDAETDLKHALDYIESQLPPKPEIPGKRVFVGEYGYPAIDHSPEKQDELSRAVMRACLSWGCPFALYWEIYNNEVTPDGVQRGFWLIDKVGVKQPVYHTMARFYAKARAYVSNFRKSHGRVPTREEFGAVAPGWLANVVSPVPTVAGRTSRSVASGMLSGIGLEAKKPAHVGSLLAR